MTTARITTTCSSNPFSSVEFNLHPCDTLCKIASPPPCYALVTQAFGRFKASRVSCLKGLTRTMEKIAKW